MDARPFHSREIGDRSRLLAVVLGILALAACDVTSTRAAARTQIELAAPKELRMQEQLEQNRAAVAAEVKAKLGWEPAEYRLEARRFDEEGKILTIDVVNLESMRNPVPGGGKSWQVLYDVRGHRVVQWLKFQ
jgi:hypothetical protein